MSHTNRILKVIEARSADQHLSSAELISYETDIGLKTVRATLRELHRAGLITFRIIGQSLVYAAA
jgi:transcription initiation factor IIE alpha subunit